MPKTCPTCRGLGIIPDAGDDAPTLKLPPIRDTVRRRPPAPVVVDLTNRVELLEALAADIRRELAAASVDEDLDVEQ